MKKNRGKIIIENHLGINQTNLFLHCCPANLMKVASGLASPPTPLQKKRGHET